MLNKEHFIKLFPVEMTDDDEDELGELPDESQFEVSDGQETEGHDAQGHMVLPESPSGEIYTLLCQKCLPCATASRRTEQVCLMKKP